MQASEVHGAMIDSQMVSWLKASDWERNTFANWFAACGINPNVMEDVWLGWINGRIETNLQELSNNSIKRQCSLGLHVGPFEVSEWDDEDQPMMMRCGACHRDFAV